MGRNDRKLQSSDEVTATELDPIRKVVFQELASYVHGVVFLGVEQHQDPSDELLIFFVRAWFRKASVRPLSAVRSLLTYPITERGSGRVGVVLSIESVQQVEINKYEVIAFESAGSLCSSWLAFTVERTDSEWTVTNSRLTGSS